MAEHRLEVVPNPSFAGLQPQMWKESLCHDRSHFIEVRCSCGADSHLHESQIQNLPKRAELGVRCSGCREYLYIKLKELRGAFAQMRKDGWIA